jgi:hypothetical protein
MHHNVSSLLTLVKLPWHFCQILSQLRFATSLGRCASDLNI